MLDSAKRSKEFVDDYLNAVDSNNRSHYFELVLCFNRLFYCDSVSFPLSGQFDQEKMLCSNYFGVVYLIESSFSDFREREKGSKRTFCVHYIYNVFSFIISGLLLLYNHFQISQETV